MVFSVFQLVVTRPTQSNEVPLTISQRREFTPSHDMVDI